MSRILVLPALLLAALPLFAAEPVQKVYAVAELVVPIGPPAALAADDCLMPACCAQAGVWSAGQLAPPKTQEDKLIKLITSSVRPLCWSQNGGDCSVEYFPIGMGLVVHAPDDVQKEVSDLLDSLRKQQDTQVCVTLRYITVPAEFFERFGLDLDLKRAPCGNPKVTCTTGKDGLQRIGIDFDCPGCCPDCCEHGGCCDQCACPPAPAVTLNEKQVQLLLEAVQGERRACVMSAPRVTLLDNQNGCVSTMERQQFVTGMNVTTVDGKQRFVPQTTSHDTGLKTTVCPKIEQDGKHVSLALNMTYTYLDCGQVPLMPVTYTIEPEFADGAKGPPIPFTQFIQQPKFTTMTVDTHLNMTSGGTMLVYGGPIERVEVIEHAVPVLSRIPYVNRLFRHRSESKVTEHMLVMVTPTLQCDHDDASACPPCPHCQQCPTPCDACPKCPAAGTVRVTTAACTSATKPCTAPAPAESRTAKVAAKLVQKYHEAVSVGQHEQAREFAQMALDLDPACFAKPFAMSCPVPLSVPMTPVPAASAVPQYQPPPMPAPVYSPMAEPTPSEEHSLRVWWEKELAAQLPGERPASLMRQAIEADLNRRLPARFVTPQK
jgi:general secretion pathway protein D